MGAEDVDNAAAFGTADYDISSRDYVGTGLIWGAPAWTQGASDGNETRGCLRCACLCDACGAMACVL